jgi:transposase InsO family protein
VRSEGAGGPSAPSATVRGIGLALWDHWAYWNRVELDFSRPGRPGDNARIEAFNGRLRQECLAQHWFASLVDVQATLDAWRPAEMA